MTNRLLVAALAGWALAWTGVLVASFGADLPRHPSVPETAAAPILTTSPTSTSTSSTSSTSTSTSTSLPLSTFDIDVPDLCLPGGYAPGDLVSGHRLPLFVAELVCKLWPEDAQRFAIAMISCESGFDPAARRLGGTDSGLAQFIASSWDGYARLYDVEWTHREDVFDPVKNLELAAFAYSLHGRRPWFSSRSCWLPLL